MAPLQRKSSSLSKKSSSIQHITHPEHPLEAISNETEYSCDGCNTSGVGTRYHCATCSFDLHEHCAKCPDKLSSYVHPRHALLLENKASTDRFCDVCGELVNGLFYSCEECEIDIHPLCTLLALNANYHLHPQHVLRLQPGKPGWCAVCREICNFWRYRCNTCCYDVHPKCLLTGSSDPQTGGGGGDATRGLSQSQPQPQSPHMAYPGEGHVDKVATVGDGGTATRAVPPQSYPPAGYPGEVPNVGGALGTLAISNSPSPAIGVIGGGQGVPHQAPQAYPPPGYAGEVGVGVGVVDTRGIANSQSPALPYPGVGHGNSGWATQGTPYPPPQSYPMAGYGADGSGGGSPTKGIPQHQTPQSYPMPGYGSPTAGGSPKKGAFQQQAEAPTYPSTGYAVGLSQGGYQMPMMMNPGFPMGMMMAQPPTMVIYHQNYPGQGGNFGMNQQQKGMNQGEKPKKKNDDFDELAEVGKIVKKKMQFAAKYAMGVAGMASNSLAAAPVNASTYMASNSFSATPVNGTTYMR